MSKPRLLELLSIKYPIIMAPMFLVTNKEMMVAAAHAGIAGCIPALNFRTTDELRQALKDIRKNSQGSLGVNLIVNQSNPLYKKQLEVCVEERVDFFITSLGSPKEVIQQSQAKNIKVFCDVVDIEYAKKVEALGADAIIAVNSGAGGHRGSIPQSILIPQLKKSCRIPVISAGGIGEGWGLASAFALGSDGVSIGSPFIASLESGVNQDYKQACVQYGATDIVMTDKISGTPCTVINSPYVQKMGLEQNWIERLLNRNRQLKKYVKMLTFMRGMKLLEKAAFSATYKSVWCAGPSIEFSQKIQPLQVIVDQMVSECLTAQKTFSTLSLHQ